MEPFILKNESFLSLDPWVKANPGLVAGMTTKHGGVSKGSFDSLNLGFHVGDKLEDVQENRKRVANLLDFPLNNWVGAEQTHGIVLKKITKLDRGKGARYYEQSFKGTDGFYSNDKGVLLSLCFADCVPLFFISPEVGMIGTAHAGWKGTVHQIAARMIEAWGKEGISPEQIYVTIGPSICEKCYIVDNHVINLVQNILEDVDIKPYNLISAGQYTLDLRKLNKLILLKSGVPAKNIMVTKFCSSCDHELFYSHRHGQGKTGRMVSIIGWKES
ncbi:peptidoglycan editing factor PgeF [Neobacillus sp. LXY-1]|uniref:peptidoglycan editing factor PgeF n=1 Tax=Neobacillus sp. LXY-1 TaxID=3379133 RepID=UPI003EE1C7E1